MGDEERIAVAFGAAVRRLRRDQGLSQEAFAAHARIDRSYMGAIERGERNVTLAMVARIARALDLSVADLMSSFDDRG